MQKRSALKGFVAGTVGGLLGTVALDLFKQALEKGSRKAENAAGRAPVLAGQQARQTINYHLAHAQAAEFLAEAAGTSLSKGQRITATPITHFAFGALCGGVYGLLAEYHRGITFGAGTAFGTSLFAVTNEAVLPALGMLPPAFRSPAILHVEGFASHAIYGAVTEGLRTLVRNSLA